MYQRNMSKHHHHKTKCQWAYGNEKALKHQKRICGACASLGAAQLPKPLWRGSKASSLRAHIFHNSRA